MDTTRPQRSRRSTTGAASRRSSRTDGSRPSSPTRLRRLLSGNYLDDHSHYHHHPEDQSAIDDGESSDSSPEDGDDLSEKDSVAEGRLNTADSAESGESRDVTESEEVAENRMGIQDTRDIEAGPKLEKRKSTRSVRDPNLVAWKGPDDPENPKNWTTGRKWAATLIGTYI